MSNRKRKELASTGRGGAGKAAVVGVKDRRTKKARAKVIESTDGATLRGVVTLNTVTDATVCTDEATAYSGLPRNHETVKRSVSEYYVRGMAHTQGIESFWSMLKGGHCRDAQSLVGEAPATLHQRVCRRTGDARVEHVHTAASGRRWPDWWATDVLAVDRVRIAWNILTALALPGKR